MLRAVALIKKLPWLHPHTLRLSDFITSPPWGYDSCNNFLNVGIAVEIDPDIPPLTILDDLLQVQFSVNPSPHRDESGNYIDRNIDIDIIAIDQLIFNHPRLTIPHPRMHLRQFVVAPMRQLAPDWKHPVYGKL